MVSFRNRLVCSSNQQNLKTMKINDRMIQTNPARWLLAVIASGIFAGCGNEPATRIPNDPCYARQVSLHTGDSGIIRVERSTGSARTIDLKVTPGSLLGMPRVWGLTTGSKEIIVGVIENGFFYTHEDLRENIWVNPGETGLDENGIDRRLNRKDDDGNGYVDDLHGYDFAFRDPDPENISYDGKNIYRLQPYWHGTQVAGIIGAGGNNGKGICGINWEVSLMLLKPYYAALAHVDEDTTKAFRYAEAIRYAVNNGARVINWSGTLSGDTSAYSRKIIARAIEYALAHEVLIVVAVGSYRQDLDRPGNFSIPAGFTYPNLIKVTELDLMGELYTYILPSGDTLGSSYGLQTVDVAVTGSNYTTDEYHGLSTYSLGGGTSCAAPVVTGLAALMLSVNPDLGPGEIRDIIIRESVPVPSLAGKIRSGGKVDMYRSVLEAKRRYREDHDRQ